MTVDNTLTLQIDSVDLADENRWPEKRTLRICITCTHEHTNTYIIMTGVRVVC